MQIQLKTRDDHSLDAYITGPDDAPYGLVVIQEIFGVNSHMRHVADTFAAQGYRVICPAIFDRVQPSTELGYETADIRRGLALRNQIPEEKTLLDLEAAANALQTQSAIGIVGYCWGGTLAWLAAGSSQKFAAASCWYGGGIAKAKNKTPKVPVQLHFGLKDKSIPPADIAAIQSAHPAAEIHTYADADHGFGCEQRGSFNAASFELAQDRTLSFFKQHLG